MTHLPKKQPLLHRYGAKLFPVRMTVLFDGSCDLCCKTIALLRAVDVLGSIQYLDLTTPDAKILSGKVGVLPNDLLKDMHAVIGTKVVKGYEAYQHIAGRIPLLWPIYIFIWIGFVKTIGNGIYRRIADSRTCSINPRQARIKT